MGQRARIDHAWDPKGDSASRAAPALRQIWIAAFLTLFMAPFHMVFWQAGAPTWVKVIVVVFDLVVVLLWNSAFIARQCEHFATRLEREASGVEAQVKRAFDLALCRPPTAEEVTEFADYARRHGLANSCRLLFNSNEFIFVN